MKAKSGYTDKLSCCGDEPYNDTERMYVQGSKWLLHEAFCLASDAEHYAPYEKHHSTVKDACTAAEKLHVENLILYHTEDSDMGTRKERYTTTVVVKSYRRFGSRMNTLNNILCI